MSQKCKVLIVGESHVAQHINEMYKPLLRDFVTEIHIQPKEVLCFSEGSEPSNLFIDLFTDLVHMTELTSKSFESNPLLESASCLAATFSIMKEVSFVSESIKRGKSQEDLPVGSVGKYDEDFIGKCARGYGLLKFINIDKDIEKGRSSFYAMLNTNFMDALENRDDFERNFNSTLTNAIPYFSRYDGGMPASDMLTKLIDAPLNKKRQVMEQHQVILRGIRDEIMVNRITKFVSERKSKLVIISVGTNHVSNLKQLFLRNEASLFEMGALQNDIDRVFAGGMNRRKRQTKRKANKRQNKSHKNHKNSK
jgi:hypothetical protein